MMEGIYQFGFSNMVVAGGLAIAALLFGLSGKRPQLTYLLCLLALVKLVTPPIISIPGIEMSPIMTSEGGSVVTKNSLSSAGATLAPPMGGGPFSVWMEQLTLQAALMGISLLGSAVILLLSLSRALRFHRAIMAEIQPAPPEIEAMARELAGVIGLKRPPQLSITATNTSPMVWWMGRSVHVILPSSMLDSMKPEQWRWVLAHEMTHVKRRDYMVRWLEWLAGGIWWWNPIMWWARQQLRVNEERCCDAQVLARLGSDSHSYAEAILSVVEKLISPSFRSPAMASRMNSGGQLETRIKMILNQSGIRRSPKWVQALAMLGAIAILPLGFSYAETEDRSAIEESQGSERFPKNKVTFNHQQGSALNCADCHTPSAIERGVTFRSFYPRLQEGHDPHLKQNGNEISSRKRSHSELWASLF